jgi:AcrR family transcriptional regulator
MGKPHAERKIEIIESALSLAAEQGVKRVSTQAIADRVGIAQSTIFRHFKTRDAIFAASIEWLAERLFQTIDQYFTSKEPAAQRLEKLIRKQLLFVSGHKGLPRLIFSDRLHLESPVLKKAVQTIVNRYTAKLTSLVSAGIESGDFKQDLDADKTARYIAALLHGMVLRWSLFDFDFKLEDEANSIIEFINKTLLTHPK